MFKLIFSLIISGFFLFFPAYQSLSAVTFYTFTDATNNNLFSDPLNWVDGSNNHPPSTTLWNNASATTPFGFQIQYGPGFANSVTFQNGSTFNNNSNFSMIQTELFFTTNSVFNNQGFAQYGFGLSVDSSSTFSNVNGGVFVNDGTFNLSGTFNNGSNGNASATFINASDPNTGFIGSMNVSSFTPPTINNWGFFSNQTSSLGSATVSLNRTNFNNNVTGILSNQGTFNVNALSNLVNSGQIVNNGTMSVQGVSGGLFANINNNSVFNNTNALSINDFGNFNNNSGGILNNTGLLTISANGSLTNHGQITNNGTITSAPTFVNQGLYHGSGIFNGNFVNQGTVLPGNSPGIMTIVGNYSGNGSIITQIQGALVQGSDYSLLKVFGSVDLTGSILQVDLLNGFDPALGNIFTFFDFTGTLNGIFASLNLPGLDPGLTWQIAYNVPDGSFNSIQLAVVAVPEPATYLTLASCLLLIGFKQMRKRQKKAIYNS